MTPSLLSLGRLLSRTLIGALILLLAFSSSAQNNVPSNGFTMEFLKTAELASIDDVVSNVVRVVNRTSRDTRFNLDLAYPDGWRVVNDVDKLFIVPQSDTLYIPIRLIPSKQARGNVNYFISATAYSEFGNALASAPWTLAMQKISSWKLDVDNRQIYFRNDSDSSKVEISLINEGNAEEQIRIGLFPDAKLQVANQHWKPFPDNSILINLPVGSDTTIEVSVRVASDNNKGYFFTDRPDDEKNQADKKTYRLQIQAVSTADKSQMVGKRVDFMKLNNTIQFKSDEGASTIPLLIDFNAYNVLSNFTNFTLNLRGEADLGRGKFLRYTYQSVISTSVVTGTQLVGSNKFAQYSTPKYLVAAGNIGENMGMIINGNGAKGSYKLGKFEVAGIYATNATRGGRLSARDLDFIGGRLGYRLKANSNLQFQFVNRIDNFRIKEGNLYRLRFDHRFSKYHRMGLILGTSSDLDKYDSDSTFTLSGYGIEGRYSGRIKNFTVAVSGSYNSNFYLGSSSGATAYNFSVRYPFGNSRFLSFRGGVNFSEPITISRGFTFEGVLRKRNSYQLLYEWKKDFGNLSFSPQVLDEEVLGLRTSTTGVAMTYSTSKGGDMRLYTKFFAGTTRAKDYDVPPYLVAKWENRLKYKNLNVLMRYTYGPNSVTENFRVVEDQLNPQSLFLSAYALLYFRKQGISFRPRFNTSYESVLARWRITGSQEFTYYAKSGYVFTIGTELLVLKQGESPLASINAQNGVDGVLNTFQQSNFFLRIGVKKELSFKKPGRKNHNLKVIAFRDTDGNNKKDKGEEFAQNILVKVNDKPAITNENGQVTFTDLIAGEYAITSEVLGHSDGWFKSDDRPILLNKDKTIYIPLTRGVQINGSVIVQKATYSALGGEVKLDGVRISVVGQDERIYSTVTDKAGKFRMFVPFGKYSISANAAGMDERLQFAQDSYNLDIDNADANYQMTFYLIEKSRRLNIRKLDNNKKN